MQLRPTGVIGVNLTYHITRTAILISIVGVVVTWVVAIRAHSTRPGFNSRTMHCFFYFYYFIQERSDLFIFFALCQVWSYILPILLAILV
jgi:hypothetical protein